MSDDRTGILIIRAWSEGSPATLRASMRRTTDVTGGFQDSATVTDADELVELVRLWLREFLAAEAAPAGVREADPGSA